MSYSSFNIYITSNNLIFTGKRFNFTVIFNNTIITFKHLVQEIMLKFDLMYILKARGVKNPGKLLRDNGINKQVTDALIRGKTKNVPTANLEKLCIILNCTINELFTWQPDDGLNIPEDHMIHTLKKDINELNISDYIKKVPIDKIKELQKFIETGLEKDSDK
jgi:DNA-binding Xre family transcriptional regulator